MPFTVLTDGRGQNTKARSVCPWRDAEQAVVNGTTGPGSNTGLDYIADRGCMNQLNAARRTQVVAALVEGNSVRAIVRMTGVAKNTDHVWGIEEIIGLLDGNQTERAA